MFSSNCRTRGPIHSLTRKPTLETLENRLALSATAGPEIAGDTPAAAATQADVESSSVDVNGDGQLSSNDALLVINRLNRDPSREAGPGESHLDVNRDGFISPLDALRVINAIHHESTAFDQSAPSQNALNPLDINNDQQVSPIDALAIINELNRQGAHALSESDHSDPIARYLDVNGDGSVSSNDALLVINYLNNVQVIGQAAEGTSAEPTTVTESDDELSEAIDLISKDIDEVFASRDDMATAL